MLVLMYFFYPGHDWNTIRYLTFWPLRRHLFIQEHYSFKYNDGNISCLRDKSSNGTNLGQSSNKGLIRHEWMFADHEAGPKLKAIHTEVNENARFDFHNN